MIKSLNKGDSRLLLLISGFYKKKGLCIDIDECGRDPYPCHAEATCLNSPPGSYTCKCDQGWLGNGTHCEG